MEIAAGTAVIGTQRKSCRACCRHRRIDIDRMIRIESQDVRRPGDRRRNGDIASLATTAPRGDLHIRCLERSLQIGDADDGIIARRGECAGRQRVIRCRSRRNRDVVRIERPVAGLAFRCRRVDLDPCDIEDFAGSFDRSAIAAALTAPGVQSAGNRGARHRRRAHRDLAAISVRGRIAGIQRAGDIDVLALYVDCAARTICVLRCNCAGNLRGAVRGRQPDMAIDVFRAGGAYQTAVVAGQRIGIAVCRIDHHLRRGDIAAGRRIAAAGLDFDLQTARGRLQDHIITCDDANRTVRRRYAAAVSRGFADQHCIAAGLDAALIGNYARRGAGQFHGARARHECGVRRIASRSDKTAARDDSAGWCHNDTVLVYDISGAGRSQRTGNRGWGSPGHPVQRRARAIIDADGIALSDRE